MEGSVAHAHGKPRRDSLEMTTCRWISVASFSFARWLPRATLVLPRSGQRRTRYICPQTGNPGTPTLPTVVWSRFVPIRQTIVTWIENMSHRYEGFVYYRCCTDRPRPRSTSRPSMVYVHLRVLYFSWYTPSAPWNPSGLSQGGLDITSSVKPGIILSITFVWHQNVSWRPIRERRVNVNHSNLKSDWVGVESIFFTNFIESQVLAVKYCILLNVTGLPNFPSQQLFIQNSW